MNETKIQQAKQLRENGSSWREIAEILKIKNINSFRTQFYNSKKQRPKTLVRVDYLAFIDYLEKHKHESLEYEKLYDRLEGKMKRDRSTAMLILKIVNKMLSE